jgi:hypothetical protein
MAGALATSGGSAVGPAAYPTPRLAMPLCTSRRDARVSGLCTHLTSATWVNPLEDGFDLTAPIHVQELPFGQGFLLTQ